MRQRQKRAVAAIRWNMAQAPNHRRAAVSREYRVGVSQPADGLGEILGMDQSLGDLRVDLAVRDALRGGDVGLEVARGLVDELLVIELGDVAPARARELLGGELVGADPDEVA